MSVRTTPIGNEKGLSQKCGKMICFEVWYMLDHANQKCQKSNKTCFVSIIQNEFKRKQSDYL